MNWSDWSFSEFTGIGGALLHRFRYLSETKDDKDRFENLFTDGYVRFPALMGVIVSCANWDKADDPPDIGPREIRFEKAGQLLRVLRLKATLADTLAFAEFLNYSVVMAEGVTVNIVDG